MEKIKKECSTCQCYTKGYCSDSRSPLWNKYIPEDESCDVYQLAHHSVPKRGAAEKEKGE